MKLESMTKKDLLDLAKSYKIKRRTLMTKPELVKAVKSVMKGAAKPIMKKSGVKKLRKRAPLKGYEAAAAVPTKPKVKAKETEPDYYVAPYYNQDTIFFLPVSPGEEYAYWEVSSETNDRLRKELDVKVCAFELRVYCKGEDGVQQLAQQSVSERGDYYFGLWAPLKTLWAELGVWDKHGRFRTILSSSSVVMPSDVVSDKVDTQWMMVTDNWENIYKLSGVDETKHKGGASMPDHILRRVREFSASSFKGDKS